MTNVYLLMKILPALGLIIICAISRCTADISDERLCADPDCNELVSMAKTLINYRSNDPSVLSFPINTEIKVFSKSAGKRKDLWGVEINGKRGYVPRSLLREYRIFKNKLSYKVPTERFDNNVNVTEPLEANETIELETSEKENNKSNIELNESEPLSPVDSTNSHIIDSSGKSSEQAFPDAESVSPSYEVVDGTTIPLSPNELPAEPNYSTQTLSGATIVDEQPILSIHPNLASNAKPFISSFSNGGTDQHPSDEPEHPVHPDSNVSEENESRESEDSDALDLSMPASSSKEDSSSSPVITNDGNDLNTEDKNISEEFVAVELVETFEEDHAEPNKEGKDHAETNKEENEGEQIIVENSTHDPQQTIEASVEDNVKIDNEEKGEEQIVENSVHDPQHEGVNEGQLLDPQNETVNEEELLDQQHETVNEEELLDQQHETVNEEELPDQQHETVDERELLDEQYETVNGGELLDQQYETENEEESRDNEEINVDIDNSVDKQESSKEWLASNDEITDRLAPGSFENESILSNNVPSLEVSTNSDDASDNVNNGHLVRSYSAEAETIQALPTSSDIHDDTENIQHDNSAENSILEEVSNSDESGKSAIGVTISDSSESISQNEQELNVNNTVMDNNHSSDTANSVVDVAPETNVTEDSNVQPIEGNILQYNYYKPNGIMSFSHEEITTEQTSNFEEKFSTNRNLLNVEEPSQYENNQLNMDTLEVIDENNNLETKTAEYETNSNNENADVDSEPQSTKNILTTNIFGKPVAPPEVCDVNHGCVDDNPDTFSNQEGVDENEEDNDLTTLAMEHNYWETLLYLSITAFTALIFSLGYYYIENTRRDRQLVAKINKLEKELLVASKECMMLDEGLKTTKTKLNSIEDESFGSNEMVISLKTELEASQNAKLDLEDQIATLEKELESATEAGLELEQMLREFLSSQSDDNPLAQSVEDLQARLNAQQATNETLTSTLNLKSQENEALLADLATATEKCQQLEVEVIRVTEDLKVQSSSKNNLEQTLTAKIQQLEIRIKEISDDRAGLSKSLMCKEIEVKDLWEMVNQVKDKNFDFEKLCDVSQIKVEAKQLRREREDLKVRLAELEGANQLLEEHMKIIKEEIASVTKHCALAEKEKKEAETRLEVLSNFFEEKENQRYKEEAIWLQKEGEATTTIEKIQTMQNEIQNYKQQIETLKKEILDQEREYKNQISTLETKAHEQWVHARQNERRLEESKAEASQLRNRLTLVEKNISEVDPENKLHRLETNGETTTSPPLFLGPETSSSPIIFTGSSGIPPPPPSYMYGPPLERFMPPPPLSSGGAIYDISQRPPPLGGRLSSPPPLPLHPASGRYDDAGSPPPPLSPPLHNPFSHRSPPPLPFGNDRIHPPPPPLLPPLGTSHSWGDETMPPLRNSGFLPHRDQRGVRNHKGSLHSSGDSLDKSHHSGKA